MPDVAPIIPLLDEAAKSLSTYVWNLGQAALQISIAEHHLNRARNELALHKRSNTMKIEITLDKVVISADELQEIVKAHILRETGRTVEGPISYELKDEGIAGLNRRNSATAWCHLRAKA